MVVSHTRSIREILGNLRVLGNYWKSSMLVGAPPMLLMYDKVCEGVDSNPTVEVFKNI
jgi:hypothetical protein